MACKAAKWDMDEGYKCEVSGDRCVFMIPDSKACAEKFGEGPDANNDNKLPEMYKDEVGGTHDCCIGWNPQGVYCGECGRRSCNGCGNEYVEKSNDVTKTTK